MLPGISSMLLCSADESRCLLHGFTLSVFVNANGVQFLFVTHNKATMEAARQLAGVTMREPGVSRLVSVDLDEAARLAGAA